MQLSAAHAPIHFDITSLFIAVTCIAALLGILLLSTWAQERIRAMAWWGAAYLIGGFSVAVWSIETAISPPLPRGSADALIFIACGMIWSAARLFHGRPVLWGWLFAGAGVWLLACLLPEFARSPAARIVLSSLIVAGYTFLTAAELWHERRRTQLRGWPAIFVPVLHGAVFLLPIPLASLLPAADGMVSLATGWIVVFALEAALYIVGTAFIVLVLAKERSVRVLRDIALTDELTGLLNRRGFFAGAHELVQRQVKGRQPVTVLMFDIDHFKSITDRFGHTVGDEVLRLFAETLSSNLRDADVIGRFGGEEFIAMLEGSLAETVVAAERIRQKFQTAAATVGATGAEATVSIGAASGSLDVTALIVSAGGALCRARANGRNRVEGVELAAPAGPLLPPAGASEEQVADWRANDAKEAVPAS